MAGELGVSIPPCIATALTLQPLQEPIQLEDDGEPVNVTQFVRFELERNDIRYGVLDVTVQCSYRGGRAQCYLLHFFPVDSVKEKCKPTDPEWTEGFSFPPALQKLTISHEGSTIQLFHQECIAINTRGATIYGANRSYLRRMMLRIKYHEEPLLVYLAELAPSRPVVRENDPLNAFLQTRPFPAALPRRPGFWTVTDRSRRPPIRIDAQSTERELPQRYTGRAHHQIETALYDRVQALQTVVEDIEQTVEQLPPDVQGALITPLATLRAQLCAQPLSTIRFELDISLLVYQPLNYITVTLDTHQIETKEYTVDVLKDVMYSRLGQQRAAFWMALPSTGDSHVWEDPHTCTLEDLVLYYVNSRRIRPVGIANEYPRESTPFPYRPLHTVASRLHDDAMSDSPSNLSRTSSVCLVSPPWRGA